MDTINNHNGEEKKCSYCGEIIRSDARRCPYCGSLLDIRVDEVSTESKELQNSFLQYETFDNLEERKEELHAEGETQGDTEFKEAADSILNSGSSFDTINPIPKPTHEQKSFISKSDGMYIKKPLSNGMKVFLTSLCVVIPGLGQLIGIILSIVFMNSEGDADRKSFGVALLIASLIVFVFTCLYCLVLAMAVGSIKT